MFLLDIIALTCLLAKKQKLRKKIDPWLDSTTPSDKMPQLSWENGEKQQVSKN